MSSPQQDHLENALKAAASSFSYPPTPDIAASVRRALRTEAHPRVAPRLLRLAALTVLALIAVMAAVPQARALVSGWFKIGVIRILPLGQDDVVASPQFPVTATPWTATGQESPAALVPVALRDLSGLTTLSEAEQSSGLHILLPTYPDDLGAPDLVFHQPRLDLVILVWMEANDDEVPRLTLYEFLSSNPIAQKIQPTVLAETSVDGRPALWLEGPYPLEVRQGDIQWMRIVEGHSLVWERAGVTYRLESTLSMEETIRIAESIR